MYCDQNRTYSHYCNRSYIDNIYSNVFRYHVHFNFVMKKRCCSFNIAITCIMLYKCCISKLSLKFDVNTKSKFSEKQDSSRKQSNKHKNTAPQILSELYRKKL